MPSALVVYESMFGNARRVAETVAETLGRAGFDVDVRRVADAPSQPRVDLLVLGGPTHALGMSRAATRATREAHVSSEEDRARVASEPGADTGPGVREYLRRVDLSPGQPVAVFDTRASTTVRAGASKGIARRATALGGRLVTSAQSFLVTGMTGPLAPGVEDAARQWGREIARGVQPRVSELPGASRT